MAICFCEKSRHYVSRICDRYGAENFSFRKNETLYTIRLLPVGGYVRMAGDGLEEPPVEPGMNVKIKLNEENEITHIILDDHHKFQQIEAIEVKNVILKTTYS